jgi:hypothetical protein
VSLKNLIIQALTESGIDFSEEEEEENEEEK